ncbi:MAG: hypothetical protein ACP5OE_10220, partial [Thermodesulfobium sp.]
MNAAFAIFPYTITVKMKIVDNLSKQTITEKTASETVKVNSPTEMDLVYKDFFGRMVQNVI